MKTTNSTERPSPKHGDTLDCGHVLDVPESTRTTGTGASGYGLTPNGCTMCYACCTEDEKQSIVAGESLVLYYAFPAERKSTDRTYRRAFKPRLHTNVGIVGKEDLAVVTNWTGTVLGHIIKASVAEYVVCGQTIARMVSIRARMFDGSVYIGRGSWDNGSCINMRKAAR